MPAICFAAGRLTFVIGLIFCGLFTACTAVSPVELPLPTLVALATLPPPDRAAPNYATAELPVSTPQPAPAATPTSLPCTTLGEVREELLPSVIAGDLDLRVYLPPCYADRRLYPTLYMLPGNIHTDAIWDDLGLDEVATVGIIQEDWPPFLIVMVDGGWVYSHTSGGPGSYERVIVDELLPFVEANYCAWADPAGRAIGGLSRGGYWSLEIAFQHPALFGSVGGHSAALLDVAAGPDINPQQTGLSRDLGDLRIYLDFGAEDYLRTNARLLHEAMETAVPPVPHTWVLNPGGHDETYWRTHLIEYLDWYAQPWSAERTSYPPCP